MRKFIQRALNKLEKLDRERIHQLIYDIAVENERLELVLNSMNDGVLVADENHRLVLHNKPVERLLPLNLTEPGEGFIWELIADPHIAVFVERTLLEQESIMDQEFALDAGGLTRILSCSVMPLVRNGTVQGNILRVEDISEKRNREARLRRAESLASLTTLAAGVAHEIKNPLGSIGIHIQLIQRALAAEGIGKNASVQGNLHIINEEIERLNKIVVDFLFAVRPMDVTLEYADLNRLLQELLDFVSVELDEAGISIETDLTGELPELLLDDKYLKHALLNIVKNAISAMPEGGRLKLDTRLRGDEVVLRVIDNGVGMSDQVLEKIFEPYFTTKDFGSGIGLTLVYKVLREHNAEISVVSQEGKGTTFTITFRVPQKEQHLLDWHEEADT
ncbi:MAG: PAS domain S-box protein [Spirochaetaceae bacterium]|nr:MAG: PAS domain S-box protein [Spirochaetaceae bacterium]